jgi:hypothetical protein
MEDCDNMYYIQCVQSDINWVKLKYSPILTETSTFKLAIQIIELKYSAVSCA